MGRHTPCHCGGAHNRPHPPPGRGDSRRRPDHFPTGHAYRHFFSGHRHDGRLDQPRRREYPPGTRGPQPVTDTVQDQQMLGIKPAREKWICVARQIVSWTAWIARCHCVCLHWSDAPKDGVRPLGQGGQATGNLPVLPKQVPIRGQRQRYGQAFNHLGAFLLPLFFLPEVAEEQPAQDADEGAQHRQLGRRRAEHGDQSHDD